MVDTAGLSTQIWKSHSDNEIVKVKSSHRVRRGQKPNALSLIFINLITLSLLISLGNGSRHRCYVCLPSNKETTNAKDIIALFPGQTIPDCDDLQPLLSDPDAEATQAQSFIFNCPNNYSGCLLRSQGPQISRTCTLKKFRNCVLVNSVELCYCAHSNCNRDKATTESDPPHEQEPIRTSRQFDYGETDDEDLLPAHSGLHRLPGRGQFSYKTNRPTLIQDETEGSGQNSDEEELEEEIRFNITATEDTTTTHFQNPKLLTTTPEIKRNLTNTEENQIENSENSKILIIPNDPISDGDDSGYINVTLENDHEQHHSNETIVPASGDAPTSGNIKNYQHLSNIFLFLIISYLVSES